jgi:electron transport complex protein RnfD
MWMYQILAGGMLFAGVFMITDPVTSPVSKFGRVVYGATAGVITVFIRIMGAYPEGAAFSILIVNMLAPCIDYFMRGKKNTYTWKQCLGLACALVIAGCIISASVMGGWF